MNRWSGSRLDRYEKCIGAAVIPDVFVEDRPGTNYPAERGVALHDFLEHGPALGREAALEKVPPEWRDEAALIDFDEMPAALPGSYSPEVQLAWNWRTDTCRVVPRDYVFTDDEIGGRIDTLGLTDDLVVVWDYKTGKKFLGPPQRAAQLRAYGLFAARAFGKSRARVGFIRITEDGEAFFNAFTLEPWDLDVIAAELGDLRSVAEALVLSGAEPPLREGNHCRWCNAFKRCPAKGRLLGALATGETLSVTMSPEGVAAAYKRIRLFEDALAKAKSLIYGYVIEHGPVPLGDGAELFRKETPKPSVDVEAARVVIVEHFDEEVWKSSVKVEPKFTMGDFDDAVAAWHRRRTGKAKGSTDAKKAARKVLKDAGVLTTTSSFSLAERNHRPALPAGEQAQANTNQEGPDGEGP